MKSHTKLVCRIVLAYALLMFSVVHAHEGHQDEDMLIADLANLGEVNFAISCEEDAQKAMNTGVGLLHHMMYAQAELFFSKWINKAPRCAMFYWGYSMSLFHPLWPDTIQDEALQRGRAALAKTPTLKLSTREKHYLDAAIQYFRDWGEVTDTHRLKKWAKAQAFVYEENRKDIDAAAFFALAELVTAPKNDPTFSQNRKAGELLAKLREISPKHPGAIHYTIHAYDNPLLAELAVDSARDYGKIAPDVPHALHMPSHIFVRLGIWPDVISWNIRSATAALKYPTNGASSLHYPHAMDYLIYGYLQLGEVEKARRALKEIELHHPIQNNFAVAYALASIPARIALEQKNWLEASNLKARLPAYISWDTFPQVEAITYFARGIGAARTGDVKRAQENLNTLDDLYEQAEVTSPESWAPLMDAQRKAVQAWIKYASGQKDLALSLLRQAADLEDSIEKNPVTPGAVLPIRELLADMLSLQGDYSSALTMYKLSLLTKPQRLYALTGVAEVSSKTSVPADH